MSKQGEFLVYCLEMYKAAKKITGKQTVELFKRYGVTDYVTSCYEALHTTGARIHCRRYRLVRGGSPTGLIKNRFLSLFLLYCALSGSIPVLAK